jgi:hypothetical protein
MIAPLTNYLVTFRIVDPQAASSRSDGVSECANHPIDGFEREDHTVIAQRMLTNVTEELTQRAQLELQAVVENWNRERLREREKWINQQGSVLAELITTEIGKAHRRFLDHFTRRLLPLARSRISFAAVDDLCEEFRQLVLREDVGVSLKGPPDLVEAVRVRLDSDVKCIAVEGSDQPDVEICFGDTCIQTCIEHWANLTMKEIGDSVVG